MGQLAANTISKKMESSNSSGKKSGGVVDVKDFSKLHNPFDFKLSKLDFEMAFRYADVNQDNAISFADFTQSLIKVGINISDGAAKKLFKIMSPKVRPVSMQVFGSVMQAYPIELHSWLCRIMVCYFVVFFVEDFEHCFIEDIKCFLVFKVFFSVDFEVKLSYLDF